MEVACCCDIRVAGMSARFGAPIARLGFPMAPREVELVLREVGPSLARQMLLEAAVFSASDMLAARFLSRVPADKQVAAEVLATASRIVSLAPQAARLNKRTLRVLARQSSAFGEAVTTESTPGLQGTRYSYADSAEHREGILAFLEKRKPIF
jgi:enoyl-CoA hydratase/carnithine racemase